MSKVAYIFSGQGSQYVGMGKELYEAYPEFKESFQNATNLLEIPVDQYCFDMPEDEISKTKVSQGLIYSVSMAILKVIQDKLPKPDAVCGHSLGEYAALTYAGVISPDDGYKIIKLRAEAMQEAADFNPGSMFAILGSDEDTITQVCKDVDGYVVPVNFNSPAQIVIAGGVEPAQKAADILAEKGAKAVKLGVSSAFHSGFMQEAAFKLLKELKAFSFSNPCVDFYSNITGEKMTDFSNMPIYLSTHVTSPVKFTAQITNMINDGFDTFIEIGPNKILTGLVKKIDRKVTAVNIENLKTLEKAVKLFSN